MVKLVLSLFGVLGLTVLCFGVVPAGAAGRYGVDALELCDWPQYSGNCQAGLSIDLGETKFIVNGHVYKCVDEEYPRNIAYFELDSDNELSRVRIVALGAPELGEVDELGRHNITIDCDSSYCQSKEFFYVRGYFNEMERTSATFMLGRVYQYSGPCERIR